MKADITTTNRAVHHVHKFPETVGFGLVSDCVISTILCYHEDCYEGLNREMYPPEKIGPKLFLEPRK